MVRASAGSAVASIVRGHHERWDGTGRPDRLSGTDIPIGARVLAVAHMYDELTSSGTSMSDIESRLRQEGGASLDPDLVEAAIALFVRG
jgi:response regulator RpfG family c-di-GMP phosphodiesterase